MGEEAKPKVLSNVKANIIFRGPVLWILACAILVASVGLNVNSAAVIIGAMLISPLMGPIIGAGFALGIYDFRLLNRSLKNLAIATGVSVAVSAIYFFISPFKEAQSELLARTAPNIYDVLIAFFGGLAGVIAVTRVEKGLPVAGVAIATALMPPLCTAGYGLGTGNLRYFLGAMFLYTINCTFICIATYLIVKYMKYPVAGNIDKKHTRRVKYGITGIVILMLVPSAWFAYDLFQQQRFRQNVDEFLRNEFERKGQVIVYKKTSYRANPHTIDIALLSKVFTQQEIDTILEKMKLYDLGNTHLHIRQDTATFYALNNYRNENQLSEKDMIIAKLQKRIRDNNFNNAELMEEVKIFLPQITTLALANHEYILNDSVSLTIPVAVYVSEKPLPEENRVQLQNWLKSRLSLDTVKVLAD